MALGNANSNITRIPRSSRQAERIINNLSQAAEISDWFENLDVPGTEISVEEMVQRMATTTVGFNSRMLGINSFDFDPEDQSANGAVIAFLQAHQVLHGEKSSEASQILSAFYGPRAYGKGKYRKTVMGHGRSRSRQSEGALLLHRPGPERLGRSGQVQQPAPGCAPHHKGGDLWRLGRPHHG